MEFLNINNLVILYFVLGKILDTLLICYIPNIKYLIQDNFLGMPIRNTKITHQYNTRTKINCSSVLSRGKTIRQRSVGFFDSRLYNFVPEEIKSSHFLFMKEVRKWINESGEPFLTKLLI